MKKHLTLIISIVVLLGCQSNSKDNKRIELLPEPDKKLREEYDKNMEMKNSELEELTFEGISIDFRFKNDKPIFGDLFLICGYEHPNFLPDSKEFEKLSKLGFEQIDDYFGIKNQTDKGDDVLVWLFPIINGNEVYHNEGPFDAVRVTYVVVKNEKKHTELVKNIYTSFKEHLNVDVYFKDKQVDDFSLIGNTLTEIIQYCEDKLNVDPGSDKAMKLDW